MDVAQEEEVVKRERFGVDLMVEGEVLVRGTLDPMEAVRLYIECLDIQDPDILFGVAPDGGDPRSAPRKPRGLACSRRCTSGEALPYARPHR